MELLSVIVPCYNEEENVPYFYEEFCKKLTVALLESDPIWKSENGFFNRKVTVALKLTEMEKIINAPG